MFVIFRCNHRHIVYSSRQLLGHQMGLEVGRGLLLGLKPVFWVKGSAISSRTCDSWALIKVLNARFQLPEEVENPDQGSKFIIT